MGADPLLDLAIPLDDACEAGSKDCDLSLLQLRGQLKIADEQEENESGPGKKEKKKEAKKEKRKEKMEKKEKKKLRKEEKQGKGGKGTQEDSGSDDSGSADGAFLFEASPADDKKAAEK